MIPADFQQKNEKRSVIVDVSLSNVSVSLTKTCLILLSDNADDQDGISEGLSVPDCSYFKVDV